MPIHCGDNPRLSAEMNKRDSERQRYMEKRREEKKEQLKKKRTIKKKPMKYAKLRNLAYILCNTQISEARRWIMHIIQSYNQFSTYSQ